MISPVTFRNKMAHMMTQETGAQGGMRPGATPGAGTFAGDALMAGGRTVNPFNHQPGSNPGTGTTRGPGESGVIGSHDALTGSGVSCVADRQPPLRVTPYGMGDYPIMASLPESGVSPRSFPADFYAPQRSRRTAYAIRNVEGNGKRCRTRLAMEGRRAERGSFPKAAPSRDAARQVQFRNSAIGGN